MLIREEWLQKRQSSLSDARQRAIVDKGFKKDVRDTNSLVYSLNTRVEGLSFEESVLAYAAIAGHVAGLSGQQRMLARNVPQGGGDKLSIHCRQ